MNTDDDAATTIIGTEYDGQSQRSSLTSNLPDTPSHDGKTLVEDSEVEGDKSRVNSSSDDTEEELKLKVVFNYCS